MLLNPVEFARLQMRLPANVIRSLPDIEWTVPSVTALLFGYVCVYQLYAVVGQRLITYDRSPSLKASLNSLYVGLCLIYIVLSALLAFLLFSFPLEVIAGDAVFWCFRTSHLLTRVLCLSVLNRAIQLSETLMFALRGDHVTPSHAFHHAAMLFTSFLWFYTRSAIGLVFAALNAVDNLLHYLTRVCVLWGCGGGLCDTLRLCRRYWTVLETRAGTLAVAAHALYIVLLAVTSDASPWEFPGADACDSNHMATMLTVVVHGAVGVIINTRRGTTFLGVEGGRRLKPTQRRE